MLRDFRLTLTRNLVPQAGQELNVRRPVGGTAGAAATHQFDLRNVAGNIGLFRLPREEDVSVRPGVSPEKLVICKRCGVGLCSDSTCFQDYHN